MNANIPFKSATTVAGGTAGGLLTFAALGNDGFFPGAKCWLMLANSSDSQYCKVVALVGTTQVKVRFLPEPDLGLNDPKIVSGVVRPNTHGYSDCTAYLTGSILTQPAQACEVNQPLFDPIAKSN